MTRRAHRLAYAVMAGAAAVAFTLPPGASWPAAVTGASVALAWWVLSIPTDLPPVVSHEDTTGRYPSWSSLSQDGRA